MFVGDLRVTDSVPALARAVETQASVLLSIVATDKTSFIHVLKAIFREQHPILGRRTREVLKVTPKADDTIAVGFAAAQTATEAEDA
jgi:hypothetical protein